MKTVKCEIPLCLKVGKFLLKNGFVIGDIKGKRIPLEYRDYFSVLFYDKDILPKKDSFFIKNKRKMVNLGIFRFKEPETFILFGRKYINLAEKLVSSINETLGCDFCLVLYSEEIKMERIPCCNYE